jgi:hypothetical protein
MTSLLVILQPNGTEVMTGIQGQLVNASNFIVLHSSNVWVLHRKHAQVALKRTAIGHVPGDSNFP